MHKKGIIRIALVTLAVMLIPILGSIFVEGWNWGPMDFIVAALIVFSTGLIYHFISIRVDKPSYRAGIAVAAVASFLVVWVDMAVGIIGEDNNANLYFLFLPIIALVGAFVVRFKPKSLSMLAFAIAFLQILIPVVALMISSENFAPGPVQVIAINCGFALMWIASGLFLRHASRL